MDMTRDIKERLELFDCITYIERLALNMEQIEKFKPPPNPAKITDTRFNKYVQLYGLNSWELDALEPSVLTNLISENVKNFIDPDRWKETEDKENHWKKQMENLKGNLSG